MTRQEEIREGIRHTFDGWGIQDWDINHSAIDDLLNYLHSQGVVIKVDRELPQHLKMMWCRGSDMKFEEFALEDSIRKAGYVAVEPLIEKE